MKKNYFGLVGSIFGLATVFVYGALFVVVGPYEYKICEIMLGVFDGSSSFLSSNNTILSLSVLATIGVFFVGLYGLIQGLDGIKNNKDNSLKIFAGSTISLFCAIYYIIALSQRLDVRADVETAIGIGAIEFIILSIAYFIFALLGLIIDDDKNKLSDDDKSNNISK